MDYQAWKLFIDAAELGSLSKTAEAYRTTQPHISRQISALEAECGGRLFQRTGRGVVLTELGLRIMPKVREWLAGTEQLANDIRTTSGTPVGAVRIGTLPSTAHPLVSTLYYQLKERYPLIRLQVREGQGAQLETWLDEGSVDLAILYRQADTSADGDIPLLQTPTYLVARRGDPLTAGETVPFSALHKLPLVLFCRPSSWRDRLDLLCEQQGVALNVALEADSLGLQTRVIADGGVYGLLGRYAISAAPEHELLQYARLVEPDISRYVALAMSRHGKLTLACRTVMRLTQEIVMEAMASSTPRASTRPVADP